MKTILSLNLYLLFFALSSIAEARPFPASQLHIFDHLSIVERCKAYFDLAAWDQARPHCITAAESGDEESDYFLAIMSLDYEKMHMYWFKHAPLGHSGSQFGLADAYFYGYAPAEKKDHNKATFWFEKHAKKGNSRAQLYLGTISVLERYGIEQNYETAFDWYLKAANLDEAIAQRRVGRMYLEGRGVKQDFEKARFWFERAISNRDSSNDAMTDLGWMYEQGVGLEQDYKKAIELYQDAARLPCSNARYFLGMLYYEGRGLEKDHVKAYELLKELSLCTREDLDLMVTAGPQNFEDARTQLAIMNKRNEPASVK